MSRKQQTFKDWESTEIVNSAYNYLSKVMTVRVRDDPANHKFEYYESFYGVPEETWHEFLMQDTPEEFYHRKILPIFKHKKAGGG